MPDTVYSQAAAVTLVAHSDNIVIRPITAQEVASLAAFPGRVTVEDGALKALYANMPDVDTDDDDDDDDDDNDNVIDGAVLGARALNDLNNAHLVTRGVLGDFVITGLPDAPALIVTPDTKTQIDRMNLLERHAEYSAENQRYTKTGMPIVAMRANTHGTVIDEETNTRVHAHAGQYVTRGRNGLEVVTNQQALYRAGANGQPLVPVSEDAASTARKLFRMAAENGGLQTSVAPHIREILNIRNQMAASADTGNPPDALRDLDAAIYSDPTATDLLTDAEHAAVIRISTASHAGANTEEAFPRIGACDSYFGRLVPRLNGERRDAGANDDQMLPALNRMARLGSNQELRKEAVRMTFRNLFNQYTQVPLESIQVINYRGAHDGGFVQLMSALRREGRQVSQGGPFRFANMPSYTSQSHGIFNMHGADFLIIEEPRGVAVFVWPDRNSLEAAARADRQADLALPQNRQAIEVNVGGQNPLLGQMELMPQAAPEVLYPNLEAIPLATERDIARASAMLGVPVATVMGGDVARGMPMGAVVDRSKGIIVSAYSSDGNRVISQIGAGGNAPNHAERQIALANLDLRNAPQAPRM